MRNLFSSQLATNQHFVVSPSHLNTSSRLTPNSTWCLWMWRDETKCRYPISWAWDRPVYPADRLTMTGIHVFKGFFSTTSTMVSLLCCSSCVPSLSLPPWATSTVLPVLQALAARCEHWTVELGPSPSLNPVPSSLPSCTSSPNLHRPQNSPSVLPVSPVPPARRCLLPHYPGGEYPPVLRTAAVQGCQTLCLTPPWPMSSQCLSPLWPSSSPSNPSLNPLWPPVCVIPRAGYPGHHKVQ